MAENPSVPRVAIRIYRGRHLRLETFFLVHNVRGCWAFPAEDSIDRDALSAGAIPLDPGQLEELPQPSDKPRLFSYGLILNLPEPPRMPPALLGRRKQKDRGSLH
jgi:hypothetical protein